jgi:hypothetical protein
MMRASSINYIVTIVCLVAVGFGCNLGAQENLYVAKDPGSKGLRWVSDSGKTAFLQQSQDLVRWEYMLHYDVGDGSERLFQPSQNLGEDNKGLIFYRLQTYPTNLDNPDDTDGDGLHNLFELSHGYLPILTDSDDDGVADGDEDLDEDGESNLTEIANGTDASDSSSNSGDGVLKPDVVKKVRGKDYDIDNMKTLWTLDGNLYLPSSPFSVFHTTSMGEWVPEDEIANTWYRGAHHTFGWNEWFQSDVWAIGHFDHILVNEGDLVDYPIRRSYIKVTSSANERAPEPTISVVTITIPAGERESNIVELRPLSVYQQVTVELIPIDIVPDYNRDGMIGDADLSLAMNFAPFVFWVNDDNDDNEIHEYADVPGAGTDGEDMRINGERDLVDFFPVQLRLADILEILPADQYSYVISHATGALNFLEMPTVEPESQRGFYGAGSYLANEDMAYEAMGRSDQGKMKSTAGEGSELSGEYLEAAKNGKGVLLIEAKKETEQSFELVVSERQTGLNIARIKDICKLSTKKVEKLYWRADLRPAIYDEPVQDIIGAEDERHVKLLKNRWFVFCHGYNVDQKSARGWNAEMFKRMTQMGFQSKFLGVTWEGNQGQLGGLMGLFLSVTPDYWHNVYNALRSSTHLASAVNSLEGGKVVISGHSLGNMLVGSAICNQGLNAEQYFMLNAAVPREAYSASHAEDDRRLVGHPDWYAKDERLWSTDYWKLFNGTDDNRAKLTWQGQFASLVNQTTPHNYYSKGEDVLKSGDGTVPGLITDVTIKSKSAWIKQEMNKGKLSKKIASGFKQANGGWGQNSKWVNGAPAQNEPLKAEPYFKPFTEFFDSNNIAHSIHGADGSLLANEYLVRNYLLGHDIPALSNPAGSEKVYLGGDIQLQNTDMMAKLKTGNWGDWKHSDLKKQQMGRVWKLYADMITKGKLNKELRPPSIN